MDPEESECERLLRVGDPQAVPRLMRRYQRPILSFLYHCVRDRGAAEDLLQETFVRVWKSKDRFQAQGRLSGWLFTIARRLAIDFSKKRKNRAVEPAEGAEARVPDPSPRPDEAAEAGSLREKVEEAIASLPPEQREVFLMREYGGLSFAEIAKTAGCPLGTALARMRYAVLKLRKSLGDVYA